MLDSKILMYFLWDSFPFLQGVLHNTVAMFVFSISTDGESGWIQILSDRKHKGKIHLCIKRLASFSLNHSNVSFCFSIWNTVGLIVFIPCPSQPLGCGQHQQQKTGAGYSLKKNNVVCFFECFRIPFSFLFFCWISYLGVKGSLGERKQLEWGDSLIRGVHADETYLGRPCVHEAPKLPVLKHWLAVSSVFFAWIRKGCCAFHLV